MAEIKKYILTALVDMVKIMLDMVRATREGNWMLHLGAIRQFCP